MPREVILCDCKNRGELIKIASSGSDVPLGEAKSYTRYFACSTCGDVYSRYETREWGQPTKYSDWRKYDGPLFAEEIKKYASNCSGWIGSSDEWKILRKREIHYNLLGTLDDILTRI